jgi:hypothetical protein
VDYRYEDRKKVRKSEGDIGAIRKVLTPLPKTPIITQKTKKERTCQPGNAFEDTALKPGFEIVQCSTRL